MSDMPSEGPRASVVFAVTAVGAVAHRELLRNTPIDAEKAILTDAHCRTRRCGSAQLGELISSQLNVEIEDLYLNRLDLTMNTCCRDRR